MYIHSLLGALLGSALFMWKSHRQDDHVCITLACWGERVERLDLCVHSRRSVEEIWQQSNFGVCVLSCSVDGGGFKQHILHGDSSWERKNKKRERRCSIKYILYLCRIWWFCIQFYLCFVSCMNILLHTQGIVGARLLSLSCCVSHTVSPHGMLPMEAGSLVHRFRHLHRLCTRELSVFY